MLDGGRYGLVLDGRRKFKFWMEEGSLVLDGRRYFSVG